MAIAAFDTYVAAKTLRAAGFDEKQAEAAVTVIRDAVIESSATKADLQTGLAGLRAEMATRADQERLQTNQDELRAEMQAGQDRLRGEMQAGLDRLQAGQDKLRGEMQAGLDKLRDETVTKEDLRTGLEASESRIKAAWRDDMIRMILAIVAVMVAGFGAMLAV